MSLCKYQTLSDCLSPVGAGLTPARHRKQCNDCITTNEAVHLEIESRQRHRNWTQDRAGVRLYFNKDIEALKNEFNFLTDSSMETITLRQQLLNNLMKTPHQRLPVVLNSGHVLHTIWAKANVIRAAVPLNPGKMGLFNVHKTYRLTGLLRSQLEKIYQLDSKVI